MNKVLKLLEDKVYANSAYYYQGELRQPVQHQKQNNNRIIVVAAQYIFESKTFFNITKKKELNLAINIYVKQQSPFTNYHHWFETIKGDKGYFVVVYYIQRADYQTIIGYQQNGGLVLPEQLIVRQHPKQLTCAISGEGRYIEDTNYGVQYLTKQTGPLAQFMAEDDNEVSVTDFYLKLLASLSLKTLAPYLRYLHRGENSGFTLKVGHLLAITSVMVTYLAATSGYVYYQHKSSKLEYDENKVILKKLKLAERKLTDAQDLLTQKNKPFENYLFTYTLFDVLVDVPVYVEVLSFSINSKEITLNGVSDDAGSVFKALSNNKKLRELRYIRPVRKSGGRDSFTIGFKLANPV